MQTVLLICQLIALVLSDGPPTLPQDIHVDNWMLKWTPSSTESDVTYTVQYSRFDEEKWLNVKSCVHTSLNSCNVNFTKVESQFGCVKIRLLTEKKGWTSKPLQACSRQGDSCTPDLSLTARPGSLTVHLSREHILANENGDHAGYRVCYSKEKQSLPLHCQDSTASLTFTDLEEGQRYCVQAQYTNFNNRVGLPSCMKCEDIPNGRPSPNQPGIIVGVVVFLTVIVLSILAYVLIFQRQRIKRLLQPPVQIPPSFLCHGQHIQLSPTSDEECDRISEIVPRYVRGD